MILSRLAGVSCAALLTTLAGCAVSPPAPEADPALWEQHRSAASRITQWQLDGRIALRRSDEGWHADLHWQQRDEKFEVRLSGPLGQGGAHLQGDETGVALTLSDRSTYHAADPEELMRQRLGWAVPVQGLRYWVRGLPVPGIAETHRLDERGRLRELAQDGWHVRFARYDESAAVALPARLELTRGDLHVKLVVERWDTDLL